MSNALAALRGRMKDALVGKNFFAFSTAPDNAAPPMAYVGPNGPYVSREGAAFGRVIAHNQVVLIASPGMNEERADELDQMIVDALVALEDVTDTFDVGRPGQIMLGGQSYLAVAIDTTTEIDPTEESP